ncbi:N-acetylmuramoyl-L-alanine amidase [Staphylococcus hominis]
MNKKVLATAIIGTGALSTIFAHQAEAATTHTVKSGESLWSISNRYGISIAKLKSLNGLTSNLIFPNQVLTVSGSSSSHSYSSNSGNTYTVKSGDSLSSIASRYGTTYRHIMDLNGLRSFLIFPGQTLTVSGTASSSSHTQSSSNSSGSSSYYTVRYGDSLSVIAWKYNTTYQNIMRLNGLNNFFIYPGQKLRVSGTASSSSNTNSTSSSSNYYYNTPIFHHRNLYDWGQCTWHVFNRRAQIGKGISTYWWNANNWDDAAVRDGYKIDYNPTVGSIAQSDAGYYGHVAFVERVNSNGSVLVSEMNFSASPGILTYRTIPAYQVRHYKFIH